MVHVTFYSTYSNRNVIHKFLDPVITTTADLYDNTNVLNPELKLVWDNSYVSSANYFYIQEFNRYYFLEDIVAEPGGAARVKGSVDVLYTYKESIGYDHIVITRAFNSKPWADTDPSKLFSNTTGPTYLKDNKLPLKPNRDIKVYDLKVDPNPFSLDTVSNAPYFVLNVMGKTPD